MTSTQTHTEHARYVQTSVITAGS